MTDDESLLYIEDFKFFTLSNEKGFNERLMLFFKAVKLALYCDITAFMFLVCFVHLCAK